MKEAWEKQYKEKSAPWNYDGFDEDFKDYPCKCNSKNCCGFIVKKASRWRVKKSLGISK